MTATIGTADGDPRLWVEDTLSAELGVERLMVVRLREGDGEFAFATMIRMGSEGRGVTMRLTLEDCRAAAVGFERIADEMTKRQATKR